MTTKNNNAYNGVYSLLHIKDSQAAADLSMSSQLPLSSVKCFFMQVLRLRTTFKSYFMRIL